MIEILDDLGVLARRNLDPATLSLSGVPFGATAATAVPRHRITEVTGSPIVHRSRTGDAIESEYYGADDRRLPLDEVIDSVMQTAGMVHFAGRFSYKIVDGAVVGFALYGAERGHLAHFGFLRSYERFLAEFGAPDRAEESRTYGDLLGYHNYYWHSRKQVYWDAWGEDGSGQLSSVSLGDYPGNAGPGQASLLG
ncbi:hypothetical protein AB0K00_43240 [Dactylosporangium sp. NPDC049525]|uniref:hypothetical protein n=1 Tax=Dactylosporangium sp. NPDC049525 TaxID=3154730 RepID=UPI0034190E59